MAGNTTQASIPYPELGDEPNIEQAVKPTAEWLDTRVVPRYATTTERDTAIVTPVAGQVCYVTGSGLMVYGTSWKRQTPISAAGSASLVFSAASSATKVVTFPAGRFSATPNVVITGSSPSGSASGITYKTYDVSSTGFTIHGLQSSAVTVTISVAWYAVEDH